MSIVLNGMYVAYSHWDECWVIMRCGDADPVLFLDADDIENRQEAEEEASRVIADGFRAISDKLAEPVTK